MDTATCFSFDTTTQFTWDGDAIALRQGDVPIARGHLADWLVLFQHCDKLKGNENVITISDALTVGWSLEQQSVTIQDSDRSAQVLVVQPGQIDRLEEKLLELNQDCCGPISFNFVADIIQEPDEILSLLQDITSFKLTSEQIVSAKASISDLPTEYEIDALDLYNLWEFHPQLAYFAKALRFYFLSA